MIHFQCGNCDKPIRVSHPNAGRQYKCPRCDKTGIIPLEGRWPLSLRLAVWLVTFVGGAVPGFMLYTTYNLSFHAAFGWTMVPFFVFFMFWKKTKMGPA